MKLEGNAFNEKLNAVRGGRPVINWSSCLMSPFTLHTRDSVGLDQVSALLVSS